MNLIRLVFLIFMLLVTDRARADHTPYPISKPLARELATQNGLSQNTVTSMAEDQIGRFWIGTQDGVNVIDGNSIKQLSSLNSKEQLSGKVVISLVADPQDRVWVATTRGLNKVNSRDFSVRILHYQHKPLLGIKNMMLLDQHNLALLVQQDLLILNLDSGEFTTEPLFAGQVTELAPASEGILLRTHSGLFLYSYGKNPVEIVVPSVQFTGSKDYLFHDRKLWMITTDQQVLSCHKGNCQPLTLPQAETKQQQKIRMFLHHNSLYFLRDDDITVYSLSNKSFRLIKPQLPVISYTTAEPNADLRVLRTGDIVTGRRQGLLIIPDRYQNLYSYPQFSPLTNNAIYALTAVKDPTVAQEQLLIATDSALQLYQFEHQDPELLQRINYPSTMTPGLFLHLNQDILLSTLEAGVFRVDLANKQMTPWPAELPELSALGTLVDITSLDDKHHLLLYHQQLVLIQQEMQGYKQLWSATVPAIKTAKMIYQNQRLVIAAYQQGLLSSFWPDWSKAPADWTVDAAGNPALDIRPTSDGQLQLMTAEQGVQLLQINPDGVKIEELSRTQQLLNTTAVCSVELSDQSWLAATHDGLALYDKNNSLVRHLTLFDGLIQKEFYQYQCGRINDKAYFAGDNGLNLIGHSEQPSQQNARLQFTHMVADGQTTPLTDQLISLTEPNTMILNYSYAPYPALAPVRFLYKLEPGNEDWFETTATTLRYTQLSPGQYQLHLKAVAFDGFVSEPLLLNLQIKPVFWRSPQAYVLYSLSFVFILWLYFRQRWQIQQAKLQVAESQQRFQREYTDTLEEAVRLRTAKLEQQQQEFLLLQQEKIEFLTSTSHDLKNLSALIQLNLADLHKYLQATGESSWRNVHSSCKLLNTLVDDVLELSKLNAGVVTPSLQAVNLPYLLQQVYQPFQLMAQERQIDLRLEIKEELLVLTDPYLLARLLMNLLDNALKNLSPGHSVQLEIKKRYRASNQVYLSVRDSGPGMPEHLRQHWGLAFQRGASGYQGSGLGLSIVRKIAELLVLPISLYSSDRGTCFELRLQQTEAEDATSDATTGYAAIIESDPQARQFLYYELVRQGYQVAVFTNAKDFARSGQRGFGVLISDIHFNATDDTIADLSLLRSSLESNGKLIFVSSDATVRVRLQDDPQLYFMVKPVKRSRLAWLLAKET